MSSLAAIFRGTLHLVQISMNFAKSYNKSQYNRHRKARTDPRITDEYVFFHQSWPSQWHRAPMIIDNIHYNCCEQYMMAQKAKLFNDTQILQQY